jgi:hypothetical protein
MTQAEDGKGGAEEKARPEARPEATPAGSPDYTYEDARRRARGLLGANADILVAKEGPYRIRVGVWVSSRFVPVGAGESFREALEDVKRRQEILGGERR